jgi:pilus assembly protein CpaF
MERLLHNFGRRFSRRSTATPKAPAAAEQVLRETAAVAEPVKSEELMSAETRGRRLNEAKIRVFNAMLEVVDLAEFGQINPEAVREELGSIVNEIVAELGLALSEAEQNTLIQDIINDTVGLGPLETLLSDDEITDILVNSPDKVYIERQGKLELTELRFREVSQLMNICTRIAAAVGRRIDEASPICDARLSDGSRVNIIIPPLSIDAPMLTIRKFRRQRITIDDLIAFGTLSEDAATFLSIAAACRTNIMISGGTGSGKTTLLNALSHEIPEDERVITVEDTAELRLQQPHVGRLETRPPNIEGIGQVTQRDLVRNCLRMRPDRIIVGEVRGAEAFDMLQAMNTGHDGSMSTIHANSPNDALIRIEDMVAMAGFNLPARNVQKQVASAIDLVVQIARLRDGSRRVTDICEIIGMGADGIEMQEVFSFDFQGMDEDGKIVGRLKAAGSSVKVFERARRLGRETEVLEILKEFEEAYAKEIGRVASAN